MIDPHEQPIVVSLFVNQWVFGRATSLPDFLSQTHHLIDRLFAVELHDEVEAQRRQFVIRFGRAGRAEHLNHQRHHDLRPAFADETERAVEIKNGMTRRFGQSDFSDDFDGSGRQKPRWADFCDAALVVSFVRHARRITASRPRFRPTGRICPNVARWRVALENGSIRIALGQWSRRLVAAEPVSQTLL